MLGITRGSNLVLSLVWYKTKYVYDKEVGYIWYTLESTFKLILNYNWGFANNWEDGEGHESKENRRKAEWNWCSQGLWDFCMNSDHRTELYNSKPILSLETSMCHMAPWTFEFKVNKGLLQRALCLRIIMIKKTWQVISLFPQTGKKRKSSLF